MAHIGGDYGAAELARHADQLVGAARAGRDLGLQVGQVLVDVARRPGTGGEQGARLGLAEPSGIHQQEVIDQHAFVVHRARVGGHGPRRDPADVSMMATRRDEEGGGVVGLQEHRHDDGDVGQMGAAVVRGVQHIDVAAPHAAPVGAAAARGDDRADALAHRPQVDRDVRGVGDQGAARVEDGARKVQPLLDVDRIGGGAQGLAHLLGAGHEAAVEHLQHDGIDIRADGRAGGQGKDPL